MSIDKNKLFANPGAKLFQETGGLSRWQELIINARKKICIVSMYSKIQSTTILVIVACFSSFTWNAINCNEKIFRLPDSILRLLLQIPSLPKK